MNNHALLLVAGALAVLVIAAGLAALRPKPRTAPELTARPPLTPREQAMYFRLVESLPGTIVLAQVSMGALVTAKNRASWNAVSQKTTDFVICTRAFRVIAAIELDDATHKRKKDADSRRDALLQSAGIRTIRYRNIPDAETLKKDFEPLSAHPLPDKRMTTEPQNGRIELYAPRKLTQRDNTIGER